MHTFFSVIVVVQVLSAIAIIGLVLLQHGKGADMGASFGSGASGSLFGATGSANVLSKLTGVFAFVFFASTLALAYLGSVRTAPAGVMDDLPAVVAPASAPAAASVPASSTQSSQIPK
jgi:preprotein translocase subunit SecG